MKISTLLFGTFLLFSSCNNDDDNSTPNITGDWKMEKTEVYSTGLKAVDYSKNNIIYHFQSGGTLRVESDTDNDGYDSGDYNYNISLENLSGNPSDEEPREFIVKTDNSKWVLDLSGNTMTLS